MPIATLVLVGAMTIVPKSPVLDFSKLPEPGGPDYKFTIRLQLANGEAIELPVTMGTAGNADDAARGVSGALSDERWNKRQDGLRLMVQDFAGSKIVGVTITGAGPKPTVRWVFAPPASPKK